MIVHFTSVIAGIALTLWSTVLTQYHELRGTTPPPPHTEVTIDTKEASNTPTSLEEVVGELIKTATTSPDTQVPRTAPPPTSPSVPFTPLPIPTQPVITTPEIPSPVNNEISPTVDTDLSDEALLKSAVVNIICIQGGGLKGVSGSGVMVDPRGIVITVAHVGQNLLLADYPEEDTGKCYIRTGSPAKNAYTAELIYISREWIADNETTFLETRPKGTGENDYAFLAITGSVTSSPLPRSFSYIPMSPIETAVNAKDRVGVGSYGAEFLTSSQVRSALYPTISFAPVDEVFTFEHGSEDVFSVHAGAAAQEGSSGGAVINEDRQLIGLITTRTVKPDLSLRDLQAITMDHIRRSFLEDMNTSLDFYFKNNSTASLVNKFVEQRVELLEVLSNALERSR